MRYVLIASMVSAAGLGIFAVNIWEEDRDPVADVTEKVELRTKEEDATVYEVEGVSVWHSRGKNAEAGIHVVEPFAPVENLAGITFFAPTADFGTPLIRYTAGNWYEEGHMQWVDYGADGKFNVRSRLLRKPPEEGGGTFTEILLDDAWIPVERANIRTGRARAGETSYRFDTDARRWVVDEDAD